MSTEDRTGPSRGAPGKGDARPQRINVAITPEVIEALETVMDRERVSLTEAVRRLIGYGDFVYRAVKIDEAELLLRKEDSIREVVLL